MPKIMILFLSLLVSSTSMPIEAPTTIDSQLDQPKTPIERELTISFVGDIMVHTPQFKSVRQADGSYDFNPWFQYVKTYFRDNDLMIGNLETTLTERKDVSGYPCFHSPPQLADALKNAGFDILGTANNHSLDNRLYGVETTLNILRSLGIKSTGTYLHNEPAEPLIVEKNDFKIGLIASTYGTNGIPLPQKYPHVVNHNKTELYRDQIKILKDNQVDILIAFVHWGDEYHRKPNNKQVEFATQLAELGVDIIIGSHPHVVQPDSWIEMQEKRSYVIYSLGNAISNQRQRYRDSGLAVSLTLHKIDDQKPTISKIDYLPFWIDKHDENGQINYAIIPLNNTPDLARLSNADKAKMEQALADFKALYQIETLSRDLK